MTTIHRCSTLPIPRPLPPPSPLPPPQLCSEGLDSPQGLMLSFLCLRSCLKWFHMWFMEAFSLGFCPCCGNLESLGNSNTPCIAAHALQLMLMEPSALSPVAPGLDNVSSCCQHQDSSVESSYLETKADSQNAQWENFLWLLPVATLCKTPIQVCGAQPEEQERGKDWAFLSHCGHLSYPLFSFCWKKNL